MEKVDKLDLKILSIISGNARVPFKDVAAVCGVTAPRGKWRYHRFRLYGESEERRL